MNEVAKINFCERNTFLNWLKMMGAEIVFAFVALHISFAFIFSYSTFIEGNPYSTHPLTGSLQFAGVGILVFLIAFYYLPISFAIFLITRLMKLQNMNVLVSVHLLHITIHLGYFYVTTVYPGSEQISDLFLSPLLLATVMSMVFKWWICKRLYLGDTKAELEKV